MEMNVDDAERLVVGTLQYLSHCARSHEGTYGPVGYIVVVTNNVITPGEKYPAGRFQSSRPAQNEADPLERERMRSNQVFLYVSKKTTSNFENSRHLKASRWPRRI